MGNQTDFDLLDRVQSGDTAAYADIVNRHKDRTFRLAFQLIKNRQDAEEIIQDGFVKAFSSLSKFNRTSSFTTWLYRIVYNLCIDKLRKKTLAVKSIEDLTTRESDQWSEVDNTVTDQESRNILNSAIESLPEEENALINLHYAYGKDMKEIGVIMNLTHTNVRKKISRIRSKLKKELERILENETTELI